MEQVKPKLVHIHYEADSDIDLTEVKIIDVAVECRQEDVIDSCGTCDGKTWCESICATLELQNRTTSWKVHAAWTNLLKFDTALHRCLFNRRESKLTDLRELTEDIEILDAQAVGEVKKEIEEYLWRFRELFSNALVCSTVLDFLEVDPHGNHIKHADAIDSVASLLRHCSRGHAPTSQPNKIKEPEAVLLQNEPAVGAAVVTKEYTAQAANEISLSMGEMISVIEMRRGESHWRGKKQLQKAEIQVGYFPADCVQLLTGGKQSAEMNVVTPKDAIAVTSPTQKNVGQLLAGLFASRPTKNSLRRSGIMRERVFGCDLGEHLSALPDQANAVPPIVAVCTATLERYGVVDGIYRLSSSSSAVQALRAKLDNEDFLINLLEEMRASEQSSKNQATVDGATPRRASTNESDSEANANASSEHGVNAPEKTEVDSGSFTCSLSSRVLKSSPPVKADVDLHSNSNDNSPPLDGFDNQSEVDGAVSSKLQNPEVQICVSAPPDSSVDASVNPVQPTKEEEERPRWFVDIHSVAAVLKMYFRELPNPLFTFELHAQFQAFIDQEPMEQLISIYKLIHQLPPPHYRTARALFKHLYTMSTHEGRTNMGSKNLAIVWSPNLLRSKRFLNAPVATVDQSAVLREMNNQTLIVELVIRNASLLFSDKLIVFRDGIPPAVSLPTAERVLLSISDAQRLHLGKTVSSNDDTDSSSRLHPTPFEAKAHRSQSSKEKERTGFGSKHVARRSHIENSQATQAGEAKREGITAFIKSPKFKRFSIKTHAAAGQRSRSPSEENGEHASTNANASNEKHVVEADKDGKKPKKPLKAKDSEKHTKEKEKDKDKEGERKISGPFSPLSPQAPSRKVTDTEKNDDSSVNLADKMRQMSASASAASLSEEEPADMPRINIRRAIRGPETEQGTSNVSRSQSIRTAPAAPRIAVKRATGSIRQPQRPSPPVSRASPTSDQRIPPYHDDDFDDDDDVIVPASNTRYTSGRNNLPKAPLSDVNEVETSETSSSLGTVQSATAPTVNVLLTTDSSGASAPLRSSQYVVVPSTLTLTQPVLSESLSPISWSDEVFVPMVTLENAPVLRPDSSKQKPSKNEPSTN